VPQTVPRGKAPAFQFYTRDWLASSKTRRMSLAERGLYIEMLAWQFEDGSVPDDPSEVAAMVGAPVAEVEAAWPRIRPLFEDRDGELVNRRLEKASQDWKRFHKERSESGRKGAEARHGRRAAKRSSRRRVSSVDNSKRHPVETENDAPSIDRASGSAIADPKPASALEVQDLNLAPPTPPDGPAVEVEDQEQGAARENALLAMDTLIKSFGKEDPRKRNPRSTSVPKDPDDQHAEAFRWLITYFPEQSPGAGTPPSVRVWMGRISNHDIVVLKRELEAGVFKPNGNGEVGWQDLSLDQRQTYITAGLNAMLRVVR
jgi:uncharacterized protein YdaU (DUF1376 family)